MGRGHTLIWLLALSLALGGLVAVPAPRAHGATIVARARLGAIVLEPQTVAVDARRGRVVVLDSTGPGVRGHVHVYDAASGRALRTIPVGAFPHGVAVDARTGRVFVVNWGDSFGARGSVSIVDAARGTVARTVTVGSNPTAAVVDPATERVFVTNADGVSVLDARSGALLRTIPRQGLAFTPVALDTRLGHAFALSAETNALGHAVLGANTVSVLDTTSGAPLHVVAEMHGPFAVAADEQSGRVFVANEDGTLSILAGRSGALLRTVTVFPHGMAKGVVVDGRSGRVFVSGDDSASTARVAVLDARTGTVVATYPGGIGGMAAVAERAGHVFVLGAHGVSMLDARTGRVLRTTPLPSAESIAVDERSGRVFVANGTGGVSALDARSGQRLW